MQENSTVMISLSVFTFITINIHVGHDTFMSNMITYSSGVEPSGLGFDPWQGRDFLFPLYCLEKLIGLEIS